MKHKQAENEFHGFSDFILLEFMGIWNDKKSNLNPVYFHQKYHIVEKRNES